MAEAMEGIMGLPNAPMNQGPQVDPNLFNQPEITAQIKRDPMAARQNLLNGMAEADPQLVAQFKSQLGSLSLPDDVIQALGQMVDMIMQEPQNYAEIRAEFLQDDPEGVFAELLPETFDLAYFTALDMALDQLAMNTAQAPQAFADGGLATLKPIAAAMAQMGRNGDSILAHITPAEARMLRARGGSGTINPVTGLPEFFFKSIVKAVKGVVKGVAKAVKGVVKGVTSAVKSIASSTIGRIGLTLLGGWALGPALWGVGGMAGSLLGASGAVALGINAAAASTVVNLASGMSFGDALKGGAVAGLTAGVGSKIFGLPQGYETPTPTTPTVENFMTDAATGQPVAGSMAAPIEQVGVNPATGAVTSPLGNALSPDITRYDLPAASTPAATAPAAMPAMAPTTPMPTLGSDLAQAQGLGQGYSIASDPSRLGITSLQPTVTEPTSLLANVQSGTGFMPGQDYLGAAMAPSAPGALGGGTTALAQVAPQAATNIPNFFEDPWGATKGFYSNYISPSRPGLPADAGMIQKYGPLAAVGLGGAYLAGAFDPIPEEPLPAAFTGPSGSELLEQDPSKYGVQLGESSTAYAPGTFGPGAAPQGYNYYDYRNSIAYMPGYVPPKPFYEMPTYARATPQYAYGYAKGGIASLAEGGTPERMGASPEYFPRKNGHISGPGGPKDDKIPAMLSDGEFVFTAKAVRGMGNGSRRKGAKKMYAMMKALEGRNG